MILDPESWMELRRFRALREAARASRRLPGRPGMTGRLTTNPKPALPTIVDIVAADAPLVGRLLCDDIEALYKDEITREIGALSVGTMRRVDSGLASALSLARFGEAIGGC